MNTIKKPHGTDALCISAGRCHNSEHILTVTLRRTNTQKTY